MNLFDICALAFLGLCILRGLWKGLVRQIIGLSGVIGGYVTAMYFYGPFAARFLKGFSPVAGHVVAFVIIFIACILIASLGGWAAGKLLNAAGLGFLNRAAGSVLGAVKGCLVVVVVTIMLVAFLPFGNGLFRGSRTIGYVAVMAAPVSRVAPESIRLRYQEKVVKIKEVQALRSEKGAR